MFSWEIQRYLEDRNYHIDSDEIYERVINTSPQISRVKLGERRDKQFSYEIYTDDGYHWKVWMKSKCYEE
jgi:hypothetical protein